MAQQGYMLIVLMISMLGISATLLGGAPIYWQSSGAEEKRDVLSNVKSALVSYAANYIDLYGPRGAGLGHFPCPDTDNNVESTSWRYDGPNPPCGVGVVAVGKLPRHLTGLTGRYSFHQQSAQQLLYSVSTRYINNPSNRVVNLDATSDEQAFLNQDVLARIAYPRTANDTEHSILIKRVDIHSAMLQRASEWVISKLLAKQDHTDFTHILDCQLNAELELLYWLGSAPLRGDNCESLEHALRDSTTLLEGVPYSTHWFFRNQWYNYITVALPSQCATLTSKQCKWRVDYAVRDRQAHIQRVPIVDLVSK